MFFIFFKECIVRFSQLIDLLFFLLPYQTNIATKNTFIDTILVLQCAQNAHNQKVLCELRDGVMQDFEDAKQKIDRII